MNIYNYHPNTHEFLSQSVAEKDPLEPEKYLVPNSATKISPPVETANKKAIFDEANQTWQLVDDYRGVNYWLGKEKHTINEIGLKPPTNSSPNEPEPTKEELIKKYREAINYIRDTKTLSEYAYNGKMIQCREKDVLKIQGANQSAILSKMTNTPYSIEWTCADNSQMNLDEDGMIGMFNALNSHTLTWHNKALAEKSKLDTMSLANLKAYKPNLN